MYISHHLNESERLYYDEKMIPSAELAYRVLKFANLSHEKQQPARATIADLIHENTEKQLKSVHDSY